MRARAFVLCSACALAGFAVALVAAQEKPDTDQPVAAVPMQEAPATQPATRPAAAHPRVVLEIEERRRPWGRIVIELYENKAPVTVRNFLRHVDEGFYDDTIFHRVFPSYVIQGGGYTSSRAEKKPPHSPIRCEADNKLKNERGTIAMARARDPHSATTQFFINMVDNPKLDHPGHDGWGYCVFGRVVEGEEIVDRIAKLPTRVAPEEQRAYIQERRTNRNAQHPERSQPMSPPSIKRAYRLTDEQQPTPAAEPAVTPPEVDRPEPFEEEFPPDEPYDDEPEPGPEPQEAGPRRKAPD